MKMIVTAGGTAGHINPALAIIDKFREKEKNIDILYIGTHNRMERDIIPEHNIKYIPMEIYGFSKTNIARDIKNIFLINKDIKMCMAIMEEFKPDIVLGIGGYVTYPVIRAASKLGIKIFIHEQNSIPGKSNLALAKYADLVGISFNNSECYFSKAKRVIYTGNPCGEYALDTKKISKASLGFKPKSKLVVIVAGSLGSTTFNEKFKAFLSTVEGEEYNILYITGKSYYEDFIKDTVFPKNVRVEPYMDNLSGLLKDTDLLISRAGASTISEIIALNLPSILIPSPYVANNHQYYNAIDLESLGAAEVIEEKNLNPNIIEVAINELIKEDKKYQDMKKALEKISTKKASTIIYEEIKEVIKND